jgi:hypothetical protein
MVATQGPFIIGKRMDFEALWSVRVERDQQAAILGAVTGARSEDATPAAHLAAKRASDGVKILHHRTAPHP